MPRRQRFADRLEIVAGVEALRDRADRLAQRLAVAEEGGAGEHVDLRAGVVDVVFARHRPAGEADEIRQRVAEYGAPSVADVHRAGRVGRHVLDVDGRDRRRRVLEPRRPGEADGVDQSGARQHGGDALVLDGEDVHGGPFNRAGLGTGRRPRAADSVSAQRVHLACRGGGRRSAR